MVTEARERLKRKARSAVIRARTCSGKRDPAFAKASAGAAHDMIEMRGHAQKTLNKKSPRKKRGLLVLDQGCYDPAGVHFSTTLSTGFTVRR